MGFLRVAGIVVVAAVGVKLANPILDKLILPVDVQKSEKEVEEKNSLLGTTKPFDPSQTDVMGYHELGFLKPEIEQLELNIGPSFILSQSFPRWFVYLVDKYYSSNEDFKKNVNEEKYETKPVDILDARKRQDNLTFEKNGFTLLKMEEPTKTTNWRSSTDVQHFQEEIRPKLMKLFPGATRIDDQWTTSRLFSR